MVLPFNNRVDSFDLLGQYIWEALEYSSNTMDENSTRFRHNLQISGVNIKINNFFEYLNKTSIATGMQVVINGTQPKGHRVVSVEILCAECTPIEYKPIDLDRMYRVITTDFLANGGNGYTMFPKHLQNYA